MFDDREKDIKWMENKEGEFRFATEEVYMQYDNVTSTNMFRILTDPNHPS